MKWLNYFRRAILAVAVAQCVAGLNSWLHGDGYGTTPLEEPFAVQTNDISLYNTLWNGNVNGANVDIKFGPDLALKSMGTPGIAISGVATLRFDGKVGRMNYRIVSNAVELSSMTDSKQVLRFQYNTNQLYSPKASLMLVTNSTREWWK